MNWPFRRRGGNAPDAGHQPGPTRPTASDTGSTSTGSPGPAAARPPAESAAWRRLPPLTGPLTAVGSARRLTAAPSTDRTVREAATMLATAATDTAAARPSEVPAGVVEGLARPVPLRHMQPRRTVDAPLDPSVAPHRPGGADKPTGRPRGERAPLPEEPAPAVDLPAPAPRRAAVAPAPQPAADLTRVTEGSVGEPRQTTVSTHPPSWLNAGAIGPDTNLASMLFPLPGDAPPPFLEGPAFPASRPGPAVRDHLTQRRNLGQSRRMGLGGALSHTPLPDPAALGEEDGRPPPGAEPLSPAPGHEAPAGPTAPAPSTTEYRAEPPAVPPPAPEPVPAPATRGDAHLPEPDGASPDGPPRPTLHHRTAATASAPDDLARAVSDLHGVDVTGTVLHTGAEATRKAGELSAKAFTKDAEVYLPDTASALDSPRTRGLIAHELTHVAQQKRYGNNLPPENSPAGRALEAEAISAERHFRGDPGVPPPLVHRRPVTAGPDPEEIRRLIAQMTPQAPAPAPLPAPAPPEPGPAAPQAEPEPVYNSPAAPQPASEPAYNGPAEMSWSPETGLLDGIQRASREEIVEEYLAELNHARRHTSDGQAPVTPDDLMRNEQWREAIEFREKRRFTRGTREETIAEFLAEKNYEQRHERGDKPPLTATDLQTNLALKDAIEFRLEESGRQGRLVADDNDDDIVEEQDAHWLKGQLGLGVAQGLASTFGITMDRKRRGEVRDFFAGRPATAAAPDTDGDAVFTPVGRTATGWNGNPPAALPQESVKGAGANNGTQARGASRVPHDTPPPWTSVFSPSVGPAQGSEPEPEESGSKAGTGFDLGKAVKGSLWAAATSAFLGAPEENAEAEKKKAEEQTAAARAAAESARTAVFDIATLKDDQLDALAHRIYGRVRDRLTSDQRRELRVHRERKGTR
ncbi:DUF4157 domain-containing protein [Streptomyces sp. H27-H1]|uniref:eCIS core domain-containing protein n=1 Tax=Streptomyces sp. H27-H1 TaxID=2996461 RepID=UPI00226F090F|nr:DUF4157 domain-containing protein [Streptomyces sp. H27-H1]MCY0931974.1 DUF4157 domain-containing protein [Streptomyces sp. H27-H1]